MSNEVKELENKIITLQSEIENSRTKWESICRQNKEREEELKLLIKDGKRAQDEIYFQLVKEKEEHWSLIKEYHANGTGQANMTNFGGWIGTPKTY
jgi:hypothetical protein